MTHNRTRIAATFAAVLLTFAACGDDNDGDASADPPRSACVIVGEIAAATPTNPASAGPEVECVQRQLTRLGYPVEPTGTYDAATVEAVAQFLRTRA